MVRVPGVNLVRLDGEVAGVISKRVAQGAVEVEQAKVDV
jgi:hypothetical protein